MSTKEQKKRIDLLQGTLDLLILRTRLLGPAHGHAIAKAIEFNYDDVCRWNRGRSILRFTGSSTGDGSRSRSVRLNNRRAKFYRLTAKARRQRVIETSKREKLTVAIARILRPAEQGAQQESKP